MNLLSYIIILYLNSSLIRVTRLEEELNKRDHALRQNDLTVSPYFGRRLKKIGDELERNK